MNAGFTTNTYKVHVHGSNWFFFFFFFFFWGGGGGGGGGGGVFFFLCVCLVRSCTLRSYFYRDSVRLKGGIKFVFLPFFSIYLPNRGT